MRVLGVGLRWCAIRAYPTCRPSRRAACRASRWWCGTRSSQRAPPPDVLARLTEGPTARSIRPRCRRSSPRPASIPARRAPAISPRVRTEMAKGEGREGRRPAGAVCAAISVSPLSTIGRTGYADILAGQSSRQADGRWHFLLRSPIRSGLWAATEAQADQREDAGWPDHFQRRSGATRSVRKSCLSTVSPEYLSWMRRVNNALAKRISHRDL